MKFSSIYKSLILFLALLITLPAMAEPTPAANPADVDAALPDRSNRPIPQDEIDADIDIDKSYDDDDDEEGVKLPAVSVGVPASLAKYLEACCKFAGCTFTPAEATAETGSSGGTQAECTCEDEGKTDKDYGTKNVTECVKMMSSLMNKLFHGSN